MKRFDIMCKIEMITEENEIVFGLIQDVDGNKLYISVVADDKDFKLFRIDDKVKCIVYAPDNIYGFDGFVTNRILGTAPVYEILSSENLEIVQRREYVRVKKSIPILYTHNKYITDKDFSNEINFSENINSIKKYLKSGFISDISGGGLRLNLYEDITANTTLLGAFELFGEVIMVKCEIVYKDILNTQDRVMYIYGVKFIDIGDKVREKIIRYVFQLMRESKLR